MFRIVSGVFLGYVAMFVFIAFGIIGLFLAFGTDRTFQAGSYEVTSLWLVGSLILSFIAAGVGGKVCGIITGRPAAVKTLAAAVLVLGVLSAVSADASRLTVRTGDVSTREAIVNAKEPIWFELLLPIVAVVGVLAGGRKSQTSPIK
jgi:hypothetical protein